MSLIKAELGTMKIQHTESRSGDTVGMKCKEEKCEISARRLKRKIEEGPARRVKSSGERERERVPFLWCSSFFGQSLVSSRLACTASRPLRSTHTNTHTLIHAHTSHLVPHFSVQL